MDSDRSLRSYRRMRESFDVTRICRSDGKTLSQSLQTHCSLKPVCIVRLRLLRYLVLSRQRLDASNFAAHAVPPPGGAHVDLRVVLKALADKQTQRRNKALLQPVLF